MSLAKLGIAALALTALACAAVADDGSDPNAFMKTPEWLGPSYVGSGSWTELESMIESLATSKKRAEDGRFQLFLVTRAINDWFELWDEDQDEHFRLKLEEYQAQIPGSAFAPILEVMRIHATAWRARGGGFASTVTPEGWALFRERNLAAWRMILATKPTSARLPTWYDQAISIGMDAGVPDEQITALFNEGIERFPGYHPIYFSYARQFSPRWGGDYAQADAFITKQVAAKTNPEGEVLYARLYWLIDQYNGGDADFFEESLVSWPRLRAGFELLMKQFPKSAWNQANFVWYACRARDANTYYTWRKTVDAGQFKQAAPAGVTLETCDARFMRKI
jgi:hypothetical protein